MNTRHNQRRSRQCRGSRARNYTRTVMRAADGTSPNTATAAVLSAAERTGALAAAQRQQGQQR